MDVSGASNRRFYFQRNRESESPLESGETEGGRIYHIKGMQICNTAKDASLFQKDVSPKNMQKRLLEVEMRPLCILCYANASIITRVGGAHRP